MSVSEAAQALRAELTGLVRVEEPLSRHTTFRIGGPADLFIECDTLSDLKSATRILGEHGIEWTLLGKGSNVLASDEGYRGAILVLGRDFKRHVLDGTHLRAGAGVILAVLVQDAFRHGLTGLEFAVGIPGTVGGALAMNAGTRDEWMDRIVECVTVFSPSEGLSSVRGPEVAWGYRSSDLPGRGIIVEASLRLESGEVEWIRRAMEASLRRRKRNQPLGTPNAGSVFVNPDGDSAGRLIESAGLKGTSIGGAAISDVHANFIVNTGGAKAADVLGLIDLIRNTVREEHGIELKAEVRLLGP